MPKWPECDKRSISSRPHRYSLWSVSSALISKLVWSGIFWSVHKCSQGYLKYPVQQSLCRMLPAFWGQESKDWSCRWSILIQKGTCYGGLKFSVTKYLPVKRWGSTIPGQGELLMQNALGQDQQELCTGCEVPDEDFGPWVVRKSCLFPRTWLEYLLLSSAVTMPWQICQSTILSSQLGFNVTCICYILLEISQESSNAADCVQE